jgi:hypothetical protein
MIATLEGEGMVNVGPNVIYQNVTPRGATWYSRGPQWGQKTSEQIHVNVLTACVERRPKFRHVCVIRFQIDNEALGAAQKENGER